MSIRRAFHEIFYDGSLYYERERFVYVPPWTKFGEPPDSYKDKLFAAKTFLGKKWCMYNKKPTKVTERKTKRKWT